MAAKCGLEAMLCCLLSSWLPSIVLARARTDVVLRGTTVGPGFNRPEA